MKRKFLEKRTWSVQAKDRLFDPVVTDNRIIGWDSHAFQRWGQTDIYPFDVPAGKDSTTPFKDLP